MKVTPIGAVFGARITDVDVMSLNDTEFAELFDHVHRFKLVVIPDQDLDDESQTMFAKRFGDLAAGSFGPKFSPMLQQISRDDKGDIGTDFDKDATRVNAGLGDGRRQAAEWHSDGMFWPEPPALGVFRLIDGPDVGGDTIFADMSAAFEALSPAMREFLSPLRAVQEVRINAQHLFSPKRLLEVQAEFPPIAHPLIRTHPVTRLRSIYASPINTSHIEGFRPDESAALLSFLFAQPNRAEFQCRVHWDQGSVGVWDNRVLVHAAVFDYGAQRRTVRRVSVAGSRPE